jgi:hypothetical protein
MTDYSCLEIVSDSDGEDYSISEQENEYCYYCSQILNYEDNEHYDFEADRYYCENCWDQCMGD